MEQKTKKSAGILKFDVNFDIKTQDKYTGKVLQEEKVKNIIVNTGLERIARRLISNTNAFFSEIAVGTGTTSATASDTALETELLKEAVTTIYEADYKAKFSHIFSFGSGTDEDVTELGIFDDATTMLNRLVFSAKKVSDSIDLIVEGTITVQRA